MVVLAVVVAAEAEVRGECFLPCTTRLPQIREHIPSRVVLAVVVVLVVPLVLMVAAEAEPRKPVERMAIQTLVVVVELVAQEPLVLQSE
jgi:hypothetical protein